MSNAIKLRMECRRLAYWKDDEGRVLGKEDEEAKQEDGEEPGKGTFPGGRVSSINHYSEVLGTENWSGARYFAFRRSLVNQPNLSQSLASFLISSQEATVGRGIRLWLISRHLHVKSLTLWVALCQGILLDCLFPTIPQRLSQLLPICFQSHTLVTA